MDRTDLDRLLHQLAEADGSDLHLKVGSPPRFRVNGDLARLPDVPGPLPEDLERVAWSIMQDRTWAHFEETNEADFAYSIPNLGRFRVNAFRQRGTIGLVFRLVRSTARSFPELNLPETVRRLADETRGLVLVTGPTGSGKTTTLAAMIDHINRTRECHIVTIEDPIEVLHHDEVSAVSQREVGFDTESFIVALRSALREDPDVILVGEMRDMETVDTALSAAETGHLVFSTLHTIDCVETINRIVDFFPPNQQRQARLEHRRRAQGDDLPATRADLGRLGTGAGSRDHGGERPSPAGDHRPGEGQRHPAHHPRGRVLRHADLRPGVGRPARAGRHRPSGGDAGGVEPARPPGGAATARPGDERLALIACEPQPSAVGARAALRPATRRERAWGPTAP